MSLKFLVIPKIFTSQLPLDSPRVIIDLEFLLVLVIAMDNI